MLVIPLGPHIALRGLIGVSLESSVKRLLVAVMVVAIMIRSVFCFVAAVVKLC